MLALNSLVALLVLGLVAAHPHGSAPEPFHHRRASARSHALRARTCKPSAHSNATTSTEPPASTPSPPTHQDLAPQISSTHLASSSSAHPASAHASSTKPAPPASTATSSPPSSGAFAALAPVSFIESWSTSSSAPKPLPLSDATFRPTSVMTELAHPYVNAPDGTLSMKATYPEGSYNFQHEPLGGLSFYAPGPADVDLTTAKEVTFGYSVFFEDGFDFNIGGKLPGIYAGDDDEVAKSCSGGRRDDRCMSVRLMWREKGAGEVYTYLPPGYSANDNVCNVPPFSTCNPTYGASVGRGSYTWEAGKSTAVSMRVRLNDVGKENGEIEFFANGDSVINVGGLVLRDSDAGRFRGLQVQTFFGGSTSDYASPKTQSTYFRDFTVAITEKL